MSYFCRTKPHYVVMTEKDEYKFVFDFENLMVWLSMSPKQGFRVYYVDELYRYYFDEKHSIVGIGWHLQKMERLERHLSKFTVSEEDRWSNCYYDLEAKGDYHLRRYRKCHTVKNFKVPKHMWNKVRVENLMVESMKDFDDDYSALISKKGRHTSMMMGWWDDYPRAKRSSGWKESTKAKRQHKSNTRSVKKDYCYNYDKITLESD